MQYTENEAALIGGLISNCFFQPSVDAKLRESLSPGAAPSARGHALCVRSEPHSERADFLVTALPRYPRSPQRHDGRDIKTDALLRASR